MCEHMKPPAIAQSPFGQSYFEHCRECNGDKGCQHESDAVFIGFLFLDRKSGCQGQAHYSKRRRRERVGALKIAVMVFAQLIPGYWFKSEAKRS